MEKEFTAQDMIEFARWLGGNVGEKHIQLYRDHLEEEKEKEYQLYLSLKAKYEK